MQTNILKYKDIKMIINTKEVLIYCTASSIRCNIHENCCSIHPVIASIYMLQYLFIYTCNNYSFINLIFHPTRQIFNIKQ